MSYHMIKKPYLLYETLDMLYRFVNGMSYRAYLSRRRAVRDEKEDRTAKLLSQLQNIMETTCQGLDPGEPELRRFFGRVETGTNQEGSCLAYFLTMSFFTLEEPDFWKNVELIHKSWHFVQEDGRWIKDYFVRGLIFTGEGTCPGDLLDQICQLELASDFQMSLYRAMRNFDQSLDALASLIWPVAQRLETTLRQADWLLEEMLQYWENAPVEPMEFFSDILDWHDSRDQETCTVVAVSLMSYNMVICKESLFQLHENHLYIGCGDDMKSQYQEQSTTFESLSGALKALSDKKRLEILARLSCGRAYGHELAEAMGVAPSNMSRNLAILCSYGFLRQEREAQKNYYEMDENVIREFLQQMEGMLLKRKNRRKNPEGQ